MPDLYYKNKNQKDAYTSSWSLKEVIGIRVWNLVWLFLYFPSPKFLNKWRILLLKLFGAKLASDVFLYPNSKIYVPWLLTMKSKACLGPKSEVYNLGPVFLGERCTISQHVYICNGTHDLSDPKSPLMVGDIEISNDVFVGACAFIMPGIKIEKFAVVGAGSVVVKNVEPYTVVGGNPAKFLKIRLIND